MSSNNAASLLSDAPLSLRWPAACHTGQHLQSAHVVTVRPAHLPIASFHQATTRLLLPGASYEVRMRPLPHACMPCASFTRRPRPQLCPLLHVCMLGARFSKRSRLWLCPLLRAHACQARAPFTRRSRPRARSCSPRARPRTCRSRATRCAGAARGPRGPPAPGRPSRRTPRR